MANTRIWYGYKPFEGKQSTRSIVLSGELSQDDIASIGRRLSRGNQFIPDQVGLPSLNADDAEPHAWHTFDLSSISRTPQKPDISLAAKDLIDRFNEVVWNPGAETARLYGTKGAPDSPIARAMHR